MHAFTIENHTVVRKHEKTWKNNGFSRKCRQRHHRKHFQWLGNVVWDISDEKYFHQIFNSYFEPCFLLNFVEIFMLFWSKLDGYVRIQHGSEDKTYENHWIFRWNLTKTWLKIGVGNLMKIFFIRNVPNNIPWSLKMLPVMPATIFPRKTIKNSRFFMYADYCRASHSKYMRWSSFAPTQWDHFLGRGRAVDLLSVRGFWIKSLAVFSYAPGMKYIQAF